MTKEQIEANTTYQRLLAKANAEGVYVAVHNKNQSFDECGNVISEDEYFIVSNPQSMKAYSVNKMGNHLKCNCPAGSRHTPVRCKHKAKVTEWLISHSHTVSEVCEAQSLAMDNEVFVNAK